MTTSTVEWRKQNERGATLIMTALILPVIVLFAGLGMGGAVVRSASDETQRTADLSALAAAESVPTLGRPSISGLPTVPSTPAVPQPPSMQNPPKPGSGFYKNNGVYQYMANSVDSVSTDIATNAGVGPLYQGAMGSLGSTWTDGCNVGAAQYATGRAKMSRSFAFKGLTPTCATSANTFPNPNNRIYVRPEFESTGEYRLYTCLVSVGDCTSLLGMGATGALSAIGQQFVSGLPITPSISCMTNPTGAGCALNASTFNSAFGTTVGAQVQAAVQAQFPGVTGLVPAQLPAAQASLNQLAGLLFGHLSGIGNACQVDLGTTGTKLCNAGVDVASLLPSTMTPRTRSTVAHCIDIPIVPSLADARCGDFSFTSQALARRTFKNAVVVPTLPARFGVDPNADMSACVRGAGLLPPITSSLGFLGSGTIGTLNTLLSTAVNLQPGATPNCRNADVDGATDNNTNFTVDLNPVLAQAQGPLVDAAIAMNNHLNDATNAVIASSLNAEDGRSRTVADCHASPPAPWCVDMGGQQIQDVRDVYNPPSGDQAPSAQDIISKAAANHEPVTLISLGKWVKVDLGAPVQTPAGTITALTYWMPALDFVPATVESFNPVNPVSSTFKVVSQASGPKGLYRGVLLDPNGAPALCTVSNDPYGKCLDEPPATVTLP